MLLGAVNALLIYLVVAPWKTPKSGKGDIGYTFRLTAQDIGVAVLALLAFVVVVVPLGLVTGILQFTPADSTHRRGCAGAGHGLPVHRAARRTAVSRADPERAGAALPEGRDRDPDRVRPDLRPCAPEQRCLRIRGAQRGLCGGRDPGGSGLRLRLAENGQDHGERDHPRVGQLHRAALPRRMIQTHATLVAREVLGPGQELRLHAPELARQLRPGQAVLVRGGWGADPYLRRTFHPIALDEETWTLRLPPSGDWAHAWLRVAPEGAELDCIGPVGNGYHLRAQARNVLCIGEGDVAWALLPAILDAAAAGLAVTFAMEADLERDLIAAGAAACRRGISHRHARRRRAGAAAADRHAGVGRYAVVCRVARFLRTAGDGDRNRAVRGRRGIRAGALPGDLSLRLRRMPGVRRRRRGRAAARLPARPGVRPEGRDPCPLNLRPATSAG